MKAIYMKALISLSSVRYLSTEEWKEYGAFVFVAGE